MCVARQIQFGAGAPVQGKGFRLSDHDPDDTGGLDLDENC